MSTAPDGNVSPTNGPQGLLMDTAFFSSSAAATVQLAATVRPVSHWFRPASYVSPAARAPRAAAESDGGQPARPFGQAKSFAKNLAPVRFRQSRASALTTSKNARQRLRLLRRAAILPEVWVPHRNDGAQPLQVACRQRPGISQGADPQQSFRQAFSNGSKFPTACG